MRPGTDADAGVWALFDHGVGNLHSLRRALERVGADVRVTTDPDDLADAAVAVLPGVGAFGHVMERLEAARDVLTARHRDGRPILGVCIGMQVLYAGSDEAPDHEGLGLVPGHVARLDPAHGKVPNMGWAPLLACAEDPLVRGIGGKHAYFVHGYAAPPGPGTLATADHGGAFTAIVRAGPTGRTIGFQFHPEKSGALGHSLLARAARSLLEAP